MYRIDSIDATGHRVAGAAVVPWGGYDAAVGKANAMADAFPGVEFVVRDRRHGLDVYRAKARRVEVES